MRRRGGPRTRYRRAGLALCAAALLASGCGEDPGQGEDEPEGDFRVEIVRAEFPQSQKLAKRSRMEIEVRNRDSKRIPNISVTVTGLDERGADSDNPQADPKRPVFAVNEIPKGGDSAFLDTYTLGPLDPGETKIFAWDVTAIEPGPFKLDYKVAAGLDAKARAIDANGRGEPRGTFAGVIRADAPSARVRDDGETIERDGEKIGPEDR